MKIGIITYWKSQDNYGQQLQCFALQTLLRSWGHDAYLIRYNPLKPVVKERRLWKRIMYALTHPSVIANLLPIDTKKKREERLEKNLQIVNSRNNPRRCFEQFRLENLKMTSQVYESFKSLRDNPPKADVYITGSDQVWHDSYYEEAINGWFLNFGDGETKRLSYAASIGRSLKREELPIFRSYLSKFDAISVREESVCRLCGEMGILAEVCLDPTMLLPVERYRKLLTPYTGEDFYAFLYVLNVKTAEEICWNQVSEYLREMGYGLKSVTGSGYCQGRELFKETTSLLATIPEWIGYIDKAQCVITTSFHGTVFAILFHRPFLTIGLKGEKSQGNTRMMQLLTALGIPERMFNIEKDFKEQMDSPINWDMVDMRLKQMQKNSLEFLRRWI